MPATMTHMQSQTQLSAFLAGGEDFFGKAQKSRLLGRSRLSFTNEVERRWRSPSSQRPKKTPCEIATESSAIFLPTIGATARAGVQTERGFRMDCHFQLFFCELCVSGGRYSHRKTMLIGWPTGEYFCQFSRPDLLHAYGRSRGTASCNVFSDNCLRSRKCV